MVVRVWRLGTISREIKRKRISGIRERLNNEMTRRRGNASDERFRSTKKRVTS